MRIEYSIDLILLLAASWEEIELSFQKFFGTSFLGTSRLASRQINRPISSRKFRRISDDRNTSNIILQTILDACSYHNFASG
jgi:hypothetical protein